MLKLIGCEFLKLKRKPLALAAAALSVLMPLACALFLSDAQSGAEAVEDMMSCLIQLSAYLLLIPLIAILAANLLFEEQDNDTMKNLLTVPVPKSALATAKMLVLLFFSVLFMAVGGLLSLGVVLLQGWEPVGFLPLFFVGLGEGIMMWVAALPCVLLVIALNRNYIISVIITFFYTMANYLLSMSEAFLTRPFGLNPATLLPGSLAFRWTYQFYDFSNPSENLAAFLELVGPYFVSTKQAFAVIGAEGLIFLVLIAAVYKHQKL